MRKQSYFNTEVMSRCCLQVLLMRVSIWEEIIELKSKNTAVAMKQAQNTKLLIYKNIVKPSVVTHL